MKRVVPAVLTLITLAAVPVSNAIAATTRTIHVASHATASKKKVTTHTYKGPGVDMMWGTVQVSIQVKGKKIINVKASAPTERSRSAFINEQALPMLKQEVLQAQNANIDMLSGATLTSEAYIQSLQGALDKAHLPTS